jgi:hypothetical protein
MTAAVQRAAYRWLVSGPLAHVVRPVLIQLEPLVSRPPYRGPQPHLVKQRIIREYAERFGLRCLVETGTYMGDMVAAMRRTFDQVYSIELDRVLYERASWRFKNDPHVHLYFGDSATILGEVIPVLSGPTLFWLDGHYSAGVTAKGATETPVRAELLHVLADTRWRHVALIDDARCFGTGDYPSVDELRALVNTQPYLSLEVAEDVIRIAPGKAQVSAR